MHDHEESREAERKQSPASKRREAGIAPRGVGNKVVATAVARVRDSKASGSPASIERLLSGVEALSGISMADVRVHLGSSKPATLNARAFASGRDIHVAPGEERHLPHEAWHIVQQRQGRVRATGTVGGTPINDDNALESEATAQGSAALTFGDAKTVDARSARAAPNVIQRVAKTYAFVCTTCDDDRIRVYSLEEEVPQTCPTCGKAMEMASRADVRTCPKPECENFQRRVYAAGDRCEGTRNGQECKGTLQGVDEELIKKYEPEDAGEVLESRLPKVVRKLVEEMRDAEDFIVRGAHHKDKKGRHTPGATKRHEKGNDRNAQQREKHIDELRRLLTEAGEQVTARMEQDVQSLIARVGQAHKRG